jgi:hypothetical protein
MTHVDAKYDAQNHHQKAQDYATNEQDLYIPSIVIFSLPSHIVDTLSGRL